MSQETTMPARLFDLIQAPLRWQLLKTGLDFGLFDHLSEPAGAKDVAAVLGVDARRTELVLDALCSMEFLEKHQGRYVLTPEAAPYLSGSGPLSFKATLNSLSAFRHGDIGALLRGDASPLAPPDMTDPAFWARSADSLRAFHQAMAADTALSLLETLPEWPDVHRFLDLGAGSEVLATRILHRRPDMRVSIFDLPPMAGIIRAALEPDDGSSPAIEILSGDYNDAPLGADYDIIWAAMTLYYARDLVGFLSKIRDALSEKGFFISFHEGLCAERTAPESHVVGRLIPALQGQDRSFSQGEIAAALEKAGFSRVDSRTVETPFGSMQLDIGRR